MAATAITPSANLNIESTTKYLWRKGVKDQVLLRLPIFTALLDRNQATWNGGSRLTRPVKTAHTDDLMQTYGPSTPLSGGRKTILDKVWFTRKSAQMPIQITMDEMLDNDGGSDTQAEDLTKIITETAQEGAKIGLMKMVYHNPTTDTSDSDLGFQSIVSALKYNATYGHVSRTALTTNGWWQGASLTDWATNDQDDARTASIALVRQMYMKCRKRSNNPEALKLFVGPDIYLALKSQVDGSVANTKGPLAVKYMAYGFESFSIDGIEIVCDYCLDNTELPAEAAVASDGWYPSKWMFMLDISTWELALHRKRSFAMTSLKWQGEVAGHPDEWLARILLAGNLVCWLPCANMWLSNVSA